MSVFTRPTQLVSELQDWPPSFTHPSDDTREAWPNVLYSNSLIESTRLPRGKKRELNSYRLEPVLSKRGFFARIVLFPLAFGVNRGLIAEMAIVIFPHG